MIHEPRSVAEAVATLDDRGPSARAYAGGTALLLVRRDFTDLVDLKSIPELRAIRVEHGSLVIGATVTLGELAGDERVRRLVPELAALPGRIANPRVLSAATLGGNLRLASPRTDPPVLLSALGAVVRCASAQGARELAVEALWEDDPLGSGEVITEVAVPVDASVSVGHARFNPRGWPTANVAVALRAAGGARVAVAASGGRPRRDRAAEAHLLRGVGSVTVADLGLEDDEHGSAEYKQHLLGVLAARALEATR